VFKIYFHTFNLEIKQLTMKFLILTLLFSISFFSFSQIKSKSVDLVIESKIFKDKRTISVFLPNAYFEEESAEKFPVAYIFDGQFEPYFTMVSSIMSYYEQTDEGVPMIVVGIHTENRWDEFVPTAKEEQSDKVKNAEQLTQFLQSEVIPMVDSMYRTKDFNVGIGHSLGGTFVINEIVKQNSIFDAVIAVSPNLTMHDEQILKDAETFFKKSPDNRRFIYSSAGTEGGMEQNFQHSLANLDSIVRKANLKNMYWKYDLLQKANHMTTFVQSFDKGYRELSWKLALLDDKLLELAIDTNSNIVDNLKIYYEDLEAFTKEKQTIDAELILNHAFNLSRNGQHKSSKDLSQYALELIETEELSKDEKKKLKDRIDNQLLRSSFHILTDEAIELAKEERYKEANELYIKAFDLGLINATHIVRMRSVPILVQAGNKEEALKQLDLLANKFELGGNGSFKNDERLIPLHSDPRWEKLMSKLEKNAEKYR